MFSYFPLIESYPFSQGYYNILKHLQMQMYLAICALIVICCLMFWIRSENKKANERQLTKWSISRQVKSVGNIVEKVKHGYGIKRIQAQQPQTLTYLCIEQNNVNILRTIIDWDLTNLRRLYLKFNNIVSVEQLNRVLMPNLQVLVLSDNHITEMRSLRRMQTKSLVWFEIQNNPARQGLDFMTEMQLGELMYMWVEFFGNDKPMTDDLHWIVKFQALHLSKFHASGLRRIKQPSLMSALRRKYFLIDLRLNLV